MSRVPDERGGCEQRGRATTAPVGGRVAFLEDKEECWNGFEGCIAIRESSPLWQPQSLPLLAVLGVLAVSCGDCSGHPLSCPQECTAQAGPSGSSQACSETL